MALIRNGSHQLTGLSRFHGAVGAYGLRAALDNSGKRKNFDSGAHAVSGVTNKASIPSGARHPIAWRLGTKAGSLASTNESQGVATASINLASGINLTATAAGTTPTVSATLQLVVSMLGSISGLSTVTGNILAALGMVGSSAGTSTATGAKNALANAYATALGTSTASLVSYATGSLAGSITPFTDLSPQNLAQYVIEYAQTTPIHADIQKVNGYEVQGDGQLGSEWGPV